MKKTVSLFTNLVLSSTLLWGVPAAIADDLIVKESAGLTSYCHMQFPAMRADTLSWNQPVFGGPENTIDFYGSCDHDPLGAEEIMAQKRVLANEPE